MPTYLFSESYEAKKIDGVNNLAWEYSVFAKDTNNIVAVGTSAVIKSSDGGKNWTTVHSTGANSMRGLQFVNDNLGFAVGGSSNSGTVVKTVNGGSTWTDITPVGVKVWLQKCSFINENTGYVVGDSAQIYKTQNGGVNFEKISPNVSKLNTFFSVCFINEMVGMVGLKDSGMIMRTTDGGHTFTKVYEDNVNIFINKICFPTPQIGYACGRYGTIIKTTDGGLTWTKQYSNTGQILWDMQFVDEKTGYVCGSGYNATGLLFATDNGGLTWFSINSRNPGVKEFRGIYILNDSNAYAVQANSHEFTHIVVKKADPRPVIQYGAEMLTTSLGNSYQWYVDSAVITPKKNDSVSVVSSIPFKQSIHYRVVVEENFKYSISEPAPALSTGLHKISSDIQMVIRNGFVVFDNSETIMNAAVFDLMGKCLYKLNEQNQIQLPKIRGMFVVEVSTSKGRFAKKIIL